MPFFLDFPYPFVILPRLYRLKGVEISMSSQKYEKKSKGTESKVKTGNKRFSSPDEMGRMMKACCPGMDGSDNMMARCCKSFMGAMRWLALIPIIIAGAALLLGYYLSPDSVRVLWMVGWGSVIGIAILCLILVRTLRGRFSMRNCCGPNLRRESE
jgi:type IV secretory pathway VirB2 component (pilin)